MLRNEEIIAFTCCWWKGEMVVTEENSLVFSQKAKCRITIRPSNSTSRYTPRDLKTSIQTNICICMFTAALLIILTNGKQPNVLQWVNG